jgi:hypothetical protein
MQFLLLPETNFLNIIFCSPVVSWAASIFVGVDGLCPAVKNRGTRKAPEVRAVVSITVQAMELFLLAWIFGAANRLWFRFL